jgi:nuclear GTP-binding protein
VGIIGYPNTGKSSIINTLKGEKCCKTAPIPGETKVWQYVTLTKRIYLIDSPGVVYDKNNESTEIETVLKGIVRAERLKNPSDFIAPILARVQPKYISKQYNIDQWTDDVDFLTKLAQYKGKLLTNGESDCNTVAKMVINDWQRVSYHLAYTYNYHNILVILIVIIIIRGNYRTLLHLLVQRMKKTMKRKMRMREKSKM